MLKKYFLTFDVNIRLDSKWLRARQFESVKVLSERRIYLDLAAYYNLLYCCLLSKRICSARCCIILIRMSLRLVFIISSVMASIPPQIRIAFALYCTYISQIFILSTVFVLSNAFWAQYEAYHSDKLAQFVIFRLYWVQAGTLAGTLT